MLKRVCENSRMGRKSAPGTKSLRVNSKSRPGISDGAQFESRCSARETADPSAPPDFLSRVAASVNCVWLSLRRTTYTVAGESGEVGHPGTLGMAKGRVAERGGPLSRDRTVVGQPEHLFHPPHPLKQPPNLPLRAPTETLRWPGFAPS
jgi:hypothetical protein